MEQMQIFVSHSHADNVFCRQLVQKLIDAGADVWYDEQKLQQGELGPIIEHELLTRPVFIVILSKAAFASHWVKKETRIAFNLYGRKPNRIILPVVLDHIERDDFDEWLFLEEFKRIQTPDTHQYTVEECIALTLNTLALASPNAPPSPLPRDPQEPIKDLIDRAKALNAQRKFADARAILFQVVQRDPENFDAWYQYGYTLDELGDFPEAQIAFGNALSIKPDSAPTWAAQGLVFIGLNRLKSALRAFEQALLYDPNALIDLKRLAVASQLADDLVRSEPPNARLWFIKGYILIGESAYVQARTAFHNGLALASDSKNKAMGWNGIGLAFASEDEFDAALDAFDQALQQSPASTETWNSKGDTLLRKKDFIAAEAAFDQALQINPDDMYALNGKSIALTEQGQYDEALVAVNAVLARNPNDPDALINMAQIYSKTNRVDEAQEASRRVQQLELGDDLRNSRASGRNRRRSKQEIAAATGDTVPAQEQGYDVVLQADPDNVEALLEKGRILLALRVYDNAAELFDRAIQLAPGTQEFWILKGDALAASFRDVAALEAYDHALQIDQRNAELWRKRAESQRHLSAFEDALISHTMSLQISPQDLLAWLSRSATYMAMQSYPEALADINHALSLDTQSIAARLALGEAYEVFGDTAAAIDTYVALLAIAPNNMIALTRKGAALRALNRTDDPTAITLATINLVEHGGQDKYPIPHAKASDIGALLPEDAMQAKMKSPLVNVRRDLQEYTQRFAGNRRPAPEAQSSLYWRNKGWVYHQAELNEPALVAYLRAIALNAQDYEAWNGVGDVYQDLERYDEALAAYDHALIGMRDETSLWNSRAATLRLLGRYHEALAAYDQALSVSTTSALAWNGRGDILMDLDRQQEALAAYTHAIELKPDQPLYWADKSDALYALQRYAEALADIDHALTLNPQRPRFWKRRAKILRALGQAAAADAATSAATQLESAAADASSINAVALLSLLAPLALPADEPIPTPTSDASPILSPAEQAASAAAAMPIPSPGTEAEDVDRSGERTLLRATASPPTIPRMRRPAFDAEVPTIRLADNPAAPPEALPQSSDQGVPPPNMPLPVARHMSASPPSPPPQGPLNQPAYTPASPPSPPPQGPLNQPAYTPAIETLIAQGDQLGRAGRHGEALQIFDQAIALSPQNPRPWFFKSLVYSSLANHQEALKCVDQAIGLDGNNGYLWSTRYDVLMAMQRYMDALAAVEVVLRQHPEDATLWRKRAQVLQTVGRYQEAQESAMRAFNLEQRHP